MIEPEVDRYLSKWAAVSDGERIETPSSWVQPVRRAGLPAILKVLKPMSDEHNAAGLLRYYGGRGAVALFEADANAFLMERATGTRSLVAMATSGYDTEAAEVLAGTIGKLHAHSGSKMPACLTPLGERFSSLFARENTDARLRRCAEMARKLLATEGETIPLHGDLHHSNVLDAGPRGWLAIDPKALLGERTYDVANLLRNPDPHGDLVHNQDRMSRLARLYARRLGLDVQRILGFAFAHAGLAASWYLDDGDDPAYSFKCVEVLSTLADA